MCATSDQVVTLGCAVVDVDIKYQLTCISQDQGEWRVFSTQASL